MHHDKHTLAIQLVDEHSPPPEPPKKLYTPPKLMLFLELNILNNPNGGGDGDAALAQS